MKTQSASNYWRRKIGDGVMSSLCMIAAGVGMFLLGSILWTLFSKGMAGMSMAVFTESMKSPGQNGGLANAIVGSLLQTGLGALIGAPIGMLVGVYLSEVGRNGPIASTVRFVNDILLSAPSVLVGLIVYQVVVVPTGHFSGYSGAVALALIAMPIVARTTEDILRLVPDAYRQGSVALGSRDNQTIRLVVLPAAFGGVLTGVLLAVARIAGETAPVLFTSFGSNLMTTDMSQPMSSLPRAIYTYAASSYGEWVELAWTGALIITLAVLALNIASRISHALVTRG